MAAVPARDRGAQWLDPVARRATRRTRTAPREGGFPVAQPVAPSSFRVQGDAAGGTGRAAGRARRLQPSIVCAPHLGSAALDWHRLCRLARYRTGALASIYRLPDRTA